MTFTPTSDASLTNVSIIKRGGTGVLSVDVIAAKLELGPVQTLAHKEGDEWVLNDPPPDYGEELRKCQRYYFVAIDYDKGINAGVSVAFQSANRAILYIQTPVTMRNMTPTIVMDGEFHMYTVDDSVEDLEFSNINQTQILTNGVRFCALTNKSLSSVVDMNVDFVPSNGTGAFIAIDCNL